MSGWPPCCRQLCMQLLKQPLPLAAFALFPNPKQASAALARPAQNFLSALRRVTVWATPFVSSSNLLSIPFFVCLEFGFRWQ